jgi:hypothetical protein
MTPRDDAESWAEGCACVVVLSLVVAIVLVKAVLWLVFKETP